MQSDNFIGSGPPRTSVPTGTDLVESILIMFILIFTHSVPYLPQLAERFEIIGEEVEAGVFVLLELHLARRPIGNEAIPYDDGVSERSKPLGAAVVIGLVAEGDKENDDERESDDEGQ